MKAHTASLATKAKEENSVLESCSDSLTITIIIGIVIAVSGTTCRLALRFQDM